MSTYVNVEEWEGETHTQSACVCKREPHLIRKCLWRDMIKLLLKFTTKINAINGIKWNRIEIKSKKMGERARVCEIEWKASTRLWPKTLIEAYTHTLNSQSIAFILVYKQRTARSSSSTCSPVCVVCEHISKLIRLENVFDIGLFTSHAHKLTERSAQTE